MSGSNMMPWALMLLVNGKIWTVNPGSTGGGSRRSQREPHRRGWQFGGSVKAQTG